MILGNLYLPLGNPLLLHSFLYDIWKNNLVHIKKYKYPYIIFIKTILLFLTFIINVNLLYSQNCNCDHIMTPSDVAIKNSIGYKGKKIKPGDIICLTAGYHEDYKYLKI